MSVCILMYSRNERLVLYLTLADVVGRKERCQLARFDLNLIWKKRGGECDSRASVSHCGNVTNKFLGYLNTFGELSVNAYGESGTWSALHYCRISYWIGCSVDHTGFMHVVRMEISIDCVCPTLKSLAFTGHIRISDWSLEIFQGWGKGNRSES